MVEPSGKTSAITACARELYGDKYVFMVLELNASDDRGIEMVRTRIKQFVMAKCNVYCDEDNKNIFKLVILDEIDRGMSDEDVVLVASYLKDFLKDKACLLITNNEKALEILEPTHTHFMFDGEIKLSGDGDLYKRIVKDGNPEFS